MNKKAFTLAEVLITLTIIGVIAALTIPNLMKKWDDTHTVASVKKAYALLGNAYKMALAENGPRDEWKFPNPETAYNSDNAKYFASVIAKYLKVKKYCASRYTKGCNLYGYDNKGNAVQYYTKDFTYKKSVDGTKLYNFLTDAGTNGFMELENGMVIFVAGLRYPKKDDAEHDSKFVVDINGAKGPNRDGYDIFSIGITMTGVSPRGGYTEDTSGCCNPTKKTASCTYKTNACAYWILRHGNVDYKYRDVSAEW